MIDDEGMMILCGIAGILGFLLLASVALPLLIMAAGITYIHHKTHRGWLRRLLLVLVIAGGCVGEMYWIEGIKWYDNQIAHEGGPQ